MAEDKPVMVLGHDIRKVPCFRKTCLYGISSGLAGALAVFLFTSRPQLASHCGMATYVTVSMVYWVQCRMQYTKTLVTSALLQEAIERANLLRGTEEDQTLKHKIEDRSTDA